MRQVLVTPTPDLGKVLNAMQELKIEGDINLATAVQVRLQWQLGECQLRTGTTAVAEDVPGCLSPAALLQSGCLQSAFVCPTAGQTTALHANRPPCLQIAQLALKHRQNKNQRQRIVIFIGSPIQEDKVGRAERLTT